MGFYINPVDMSKESWLDKHGNRLLSVCEAAKLFGTEYLPVCLVDNGIFTAAAIGYSEAELDAFNHPQDTRPKTFYAVHRNDLFQVCPEYKKYFERTIEE